MLPTGAGQPKVIRKLNDLVNLRPVAVLQTTRKEQTKATISTGGACEVQEAVSPPLPRAPTAVRPGSELKWSAGTQEEPRSNRPTRTPWRRKRPRRPGRPATETRPATWTGEGPSPGRRPRGRCTAPLSHTPLGCPRLAGHTQGEGEARFATRGAQQRERVAAGRQEERKGCMGGTTIVPTT